MKRKAALGVAVALIVLAGVLGGTDWAWLTLSAVVSIGLIAWRIGFMGEAEQGWSEALYGQQTDKARWTRQGGRFFDQDSSDTTKD